MLGVSVVSPEVAAAEPETRGGTLRVIELQLVAFIMVFSAASGLVPLLDLLFPAFATAYILALSRLSFPARAAGGGVRARARAEAGREVFSGERGFRVVGTTVGLFLPLAYVLGGFARGDHHAVGSATPHLFLLACQVLTENVVTAFFLFSPPVRALVPVVYTVRRIFLLFEWLARVWGTNPANGHIKEVAWCWFGRSLAIVNVFYFTLNLLCFLIPRVLPNAFFNYFVEKDHEDMVSKMSHDPCTIPPFSAVAQDKKSD